MVVTKEFIWYRNHFVCHITQEKNMAGIIERGLIPLNGERCRNAGDNRCGIFCLDGINNVEAWAKFLYEQQELENLKLLRFNLKRRKWYLDNSNDFVLGFYLPYKVLPEKISYLDIKDEESRTLPLTKLFDLDFLYQIKESFNNIDDNKELLVDQCRLSWRPIHQYQKIRK